MLWRQISEREARQLEAVWHRLTLEACGVPAGGGARDLRRRGCGCDRM
jgi:hypothetical protein